MLIDTHCHLNFPDKFPNPEVAIAEALAAGVGRMIAVGCDMDSSRAAVTLADRFAELFAVVGWHPTHTADYFPESLAEIERMLAHPKVVAIGEIGLDFHWDFSTPEQQKVALFDQLALARRTGAPVVFHCREAYPELLEILEQMPPHPYLLHCFAGSPAEAERAVRLGAYFGVDGPITYKNSQVLRESLRQIPAERLVVETDSPYLSPVPFRGQPNTPARVSYVCAALAQLLGMTFDECADLTTTNARKFFRMAS